MCHGQLAFEIIRTVEKLFGTATHLHAFSNDGMSPAGLYQEVRKLLDREKPQELLAMVDLRGGSCWTVGKMLAQEEGGMPILSGVNVPMVVSFLSKRERLTFEELPQVLIDDALRGVVLD